MRSAFFFKAEKFFVGFQAIDRDSHETNFFSGGRNAVDLPQVGTPERYPRDHDVTLGNLVLDGEMQIGKRRTHSVDEHRQRLWGDFHIVEA
jgi:hypothetical protein